MPPDFKSAQIQVHFPSGRPQPYQRVDFFQVSYVGLDYVVSCFQLDYQDVVSKQTDANRGADQPIATEAIPVVRLLMDKVGFERLLSEMNVVQGKVSSQ